MSLRPETLFLGLVFGAVGFIAFAMGRKDSNWKFMAIGAALMAFPYAVPGFWPQVAVGAGLCAALYFSRD